MAGETIDNGRGVQALYHNVMQAKTRGYGTVPGNSPNVSVSSTDRAVDVSAGEVWIGGSRVTVEAQTTDTNTGGESPRRDVFYIDTNGDLKVENGEPADPLQEQLDRGENTFQLFKPFPPDGSAIDGVIVAEAFIDSGASNFGAGELLDLTVLSQVSAETLKAHSVEAEEADVETFTATDATLTNATVENATLTDADVDTADVDALTAGVPTDTPLTFGDNDQFEITYNTAADRLEIRDADAEEDVAAFSKEDLLTLFLGLKLPDTVKAYFGSDRDYSARFEGGQFVIRHEDSGNEWAFSGDGDLSISGALQATGVDGLEDLTLDNLVANVKNQLPRYDDPANAPQEEGSIIKVPPSGSVTAGTYVYDDTDGYELLAEDGGANAGDLSGLTIDTAKDWGGYEITNVTLNSVLTEHGEVDFPQSTAVSYADFEGEGVLEDWNETSTLSVVSGTTESGGQALEAKSLSDGNGLAMERVTGPTPQPGDTFTIPFYLTSTDDQVRLRFAQQHGESDYLQGYEVRVLANDDTIELAERRPFNVFVDLSGDVDLSNRLTEWIYAHIAWPDDGSDWEITIEDGTGTELASGTGSPNNEFDRGMIGLLVDSASANQTTIYTDGWEGSRPLGDHITDAESGPVALGGERVEPRGELHSGPIEAPENGESVHTDLPVTDDAADGDDVGYAMQIDGEDAITVRGTADGNGGLKEASVGLEKDVGPVATDGDLYTDEKSHSKYRFVGQCTPLPNQVAMMQDETDWSPENTATEVNAETDDNLYGSQAVSLYQDGSGGSARMGYTFDSPVDLSNFAPIVAFTHALPDDGTQAEIDVKYIDDTGEYVRWRTRSATDLYGSGPYHMALTPFDETTFGGVDLQNISEVEVLFDADQVETEGIIHYLRFVETADKAYFVFTFDDSTSDTIDHAAPIMSEYGFDGAVATIADRALDPDNGMSVEEHKTLHDVYGWDTMNHSYFANAFSSDSETLAEHEQEVRKGKRFLLENGLKNGADIYTYGSGEYDKAHVEMVDKYANLAFTINYPITNAVVPDPLLVNRRKGNDPGEVENRIDRAIEYNMVAIIYLHTIGTGGEEITPSDFRTICEDLASRGEDTIEVIKPTDLLERRQEL